MTEVEHDEDKPELPFARWLIKLLIEKLVVPALVPALTAACTSAMGWYVVGQYQVKDEVKAEVEKHEAVKDVVELAGEEVTLEELERLWRERHPVQQDVSVETDETSQFVPAQFEPFPVELIEQRIKLEGKTLKR